MLAPALLLALATTQPEAPQPAASQPQPVAAPQPALAPKPALLADLDDAQCEDDPALCVATAGAHFDAGRFDRAVHLFELLVFTDPSTPKYRYYAGLAREGDGDDTAAYIHFRRYLVSNADDPDDRKSATRRITAIHARTVKVSLRTPPHDRPLTLRLARTDPRHLHEPALLVPISALPPVDGARELALSPGAWELSLTPDRLGDYEVPPLHVVVHRDARILKLELSARPLRHTLTFELAPTRALRRGVTLRLYRSGPPLTITDVKSPTIERELPPGTWTYQAHARGFLPQKQDLTLRGPLTVPIKLIPKWSGDRRKRLNLGLALAGTGLLTGLAGGLLVGYADKGLREINPSLSNITTAQKLVAMGDLGAISLGVTTGLWISAVAGSATHNHRRTWKVMLAGAILSTIGGLTSYIIVRKAFVSEDPNAIADLMKNRYPPMVTAGLVGVGLGLATGAITTAIQQRYRIKNRSNQRRASR